ncbi:MAG: hypothetical protein IPQ14_10750 [Candidatus Microthrix sp.]|uniref:hypothetical protein n=1 Tax=Candidatus Neomicrothrix sp. TaxID=2719034 RepID=UPI0025BD012D|nr:hypothetical protein [Candidatus Microthrix sp.]MBL0204776.1 hypothetical protein [Candidatus Microthrix sp.]
MGYSSIERRSRPWSKASGPTSGTYSPEGVKAGPLRPRRGCGVGLLENIKVNRILAAYLSIAFIGLFLALRLRSVCGRMLSLVPVMITTGMASLFAFALGLELSPMTAVGGPLIVAICTEFTSLMLLRFVEERKRHMAPQEAADTANHPHRARPSSSPASPGWRVWR